MCRISIALVLSQLLAHVAFSQITTLPAPQPPLSLIQQFLGLTSAQVDAILQNNQDYNRFYFQQQQQIQHAQVQIAIETAKDTLDPLAIGTLYAGIESACRDLRSQAAATQQQNLVILTDAQKAKLNTLNDALKLGPTISEAQSENLLGSPGLFPSFSPMFTFGSFVTTAGLTSGSGFSGCPSPLLTIPIFGPVPTGASQASRREGNSN